MGHNLKGGEVIELISDLGGGKTTFTKGLVSGAGSDDHVSSPTFTISNIYKTKNFEIHHFDFYRLPDAGLMEHEVAETINDKHSVVIVEWSDVVKHVLPEERVTIEIAVTSENNRKFTISYPASMKYVVEELC